jgi:hypothetical protein
VTIITLILERFQKQVAPESVTHLVTTNTLVLEVSGVPIILFFLISGLGERFPETSNVGKMSTPMYQRPEAQTVALKRSALEACMLALEMNVAHVMGKVVSPGEFSLPFIRTT